MRIDIITIFPEMFEGPFKHSMIKRAQQKGLAEIHIHNLRDYSDNKHRKVDDYPFGGGAGMVMMIQPIAACIDKLKSERRYDEISIGSYVLTGGELAAAVMVDAVIRLMPGVLSDETSALSDSFQDNLLSPPVYTRPSDYEGWVVPDVLISGNEKEIKKWQYEKAVERTRSRRPDMLES